MCNGQAPNQAPSWHVINQASYFPLFVSQVMVTLMKYNITTTLLNCAQIKNMLWERTFWLKAFIRLPQYYILYGGYNPAESENSCYI